MHVLSTGIQKSEKAALVWPNLFVISYGKPVASDQDVKINDGNYTRRLMLMHDRMFVVYS